MPPFSGCLTDPLSQTSAEYQCPGEEYTISRAVHLARLAAFYPKCRECRHRTDTGQLPLQTLEQLQRTERRIERPSLFTPEGVRGVYLNELTHTRAGKIAGALASLLWEDQPLVPRSGSPRASETKPHRHGPSVIVGHDERPSSPDIVTGVAKVLRRMGCHVIDIGLSTRPCFWYAVDHLRGVAGIHVTGSGRDPAWTGLDFVGAGALPWSRDLRLGEIERRYEQGFSRPTRHSAGQRTFHASALYEAGLWKHFHALRPLRVCCGCPNRPVRDIIERIFSKLACKLIPVPIPVRARKLHDAADADSQRLAQAVRQQKADLGILIDDDGQTCTFFDERGTLIPAPALTLVLAEALLEEAPGSGIVVEESAAANLRPMLEAWKGRVIPSGTTLTAVSQAMRRHDAQLAGGDSGRFWFRESFPTCDAVLTLAKVLQALSRSDAEFSVVAGAKLQVQ